MSLNKKTINEKLILGIDPGFDRVGVAIIGGQRGREELIYSSCIETKRTDAHEKRLSFIADELRALIKKYKPNVLAIEKLFFNVNKTNALKVAEARGVILSVASESGMSIFEYSPQAVKMSITGYGKASKGDLEFIIKKTVSIPKINTKRLDDEYDAIAVAITHSLNKKD
ncbi:MAG: crossover junction endodeoxyribonuclease RuvC [Minisyncoccia bacterium]